MPLKQDESFFPANFAYFRRRIIFYSFGFLFLSLPANCAAVHHEHLLFLCASYFYHPIRNERDRYKRQRFVSVVKRFIVSVQCCAASPARVLPACFERARNENELATKSSSKRKKRKKTRDEHNENTEMSVVNGRLRILHVVKIFSGVPCLRSDGGSFFEP